MKNNPMHQKMLLASALATIALVSSSASWATWTPAQKPTCANPPPSIAAPPITVPPTPKPTVSTLLQSLTDCIPKPTVAPPKKPFFPLPVFTPPSPPPKVTPPVITLPALPPKGSLPPFLGDGGKVCDGKDGTGSGSGTTGPAASGTSLTATAPAASGFFNRALEYDWTIHQAVDPASIQIDKGQSVSVTYIIDTTRTAVSEDDVYGVRGQACVTNSGSRPTENLTIVNAVQVKVGSGSFSDYVQKAVDTSTKPQLNAGESYCYPYETTFPVVAASAQYKSQARVTITNHSGSIGTAKGPSPSTGFSIPATPTITERDATAEVVADASACVAGMSCTTAGNDGVFNFSDTGSVLYSKELVDDNAACASAFIMPGSATLTESDSRASLGTSADISVTTAECATVITGCTLTQGYWKNHGSEWPLQKMSLGSVEYTKTQLLSIMRKSVKGNGLIALSYQLIAAKLNVAAGASAPASVSNSIAAADALIGNLVVPPVGTATMDTSKTSGLTEVLDQYNNGLAEGGPAHCQ